MGVHTSGYASFELSRELTEDEFKSWVEKAKDAEYTGGTWNEQGRVEEQFEINGNTWGDIGIVEADRKTLALTADGKVYDIVACLTAVFACLPEDVTVEGDGEFDSDGEDWACCVAENGREVVECATIAQQDATALDAIATLLHGREWDQGDIEKVADLVRGTGRLIGPPEVES